MCGWDRLVETVATVLLMLCSAVLVECLVHLSMEEFVLLKNILQKTYLSYLCL